MMNAYGRQVTGELLSLQPENGVMSEIDMDTSQLTLNKKRKILNKSLILKKLEGKKLNSCNVMIEKYI